MCTTGRLAAVVTGEGVSSDSSRTQDPCSGGVQQAGGRTTQIVATGGLNPVPLLACNGYTHVTGIKHDLQHYTLSMRMLTDSVI